MKRNDTTVILGEHGHDFEIRFSEEEKNKNRCNETIMWTCMCENLY